MVGRDTYAGKEPGRLKIAGYDIAEVICFEIAYDGIVGEVARGGCPVARRPDQQLDLHRHRAAAAAVRDHPHAVIEYGKATLVASPSGISGVIAPDGTVVRQSKEATRQVFVEEVPLRTAPTVAARLGPGPEWFLTIVGLGALVVAVFRGRGSARRTRARDAVAADATDTASVDSGTVSVDATNGGQA